MANPDVGYVKCIFTGERSPVRQDKRGKYYYVSSAGMIKPNMPSGQQWMKDNCVLGELSVLCPGDVKPVERVDDMVVDESEPNTRSAFWGIFE